MADYDAYEEGGYDGGCDRGDDGGEALLGEEGAEEDQARPMCREATEPARSPAARPPRLSCHHLPRRRILPAQEDVRGPTKDVVVYLIDANAAMFSRLPRAAFEPEDEDEDEQGGEEGAEEDVRYTFVGLALRAVLKDLRRRVFEAPRDEFALVFFGRHALNAFLSALSAWGSMSA